MSKIEFMIYADIASGTDGGCDVDPLVQDAIDLGLFYHVADIRADDVTDVFKIGNMGPEENITRHERMSSVSVGNVAISTEDGTAWFCDNIGWIELFAETAQALLKSAKVYQLTK